MLNGAPSKKGMTLQKFRVGHLKGGRGEKKRDEP